MRKSSLRACARLAAGSSHSLRANRPHQGRGSGGGAQEGRAGPLPLLAPLPCAPHPQTWGLRPGEPSSSDTLLQKLRGQWPGEAGDARSPGLTSPPLGLHPQTERLIRRQTPEEPTAPECRRQRGSDRDRAEPPWRGFRCDTEERRPLLNPHERCDGPAGRALWSPRSADGEAESRSGPAAGRDRRPRAWLLSALRVEPALRRHSSSWSFPSLLTGKP